MFKRKYYATILIMLLMISCKRSHHEFYFDVKKQEIASCDKVPIYSLTIYNDSIKTNGFLYEASAIFIWNGDRKSTPNNFSFSNIADEYNYSVGGLNSNSNFKFKPKCKYIIEKSGGGNLSFKIGVWVDSNGKVYKTTHSKCGFKSLE